MKNPSAHPAASFATADPVEAGTPVPRGVMTVYAKKLNGAQRRMLTEYEGITGFEPMQQADLDAGEITFEELWQINFQWLESVLAEVQNIDRRGAGI